MVWCCTAKARLVEIVLLGSIALGPGAAHAADPVPAPSSNPSSNPSSTASPSEELLLGRFPAVIENGRKLAPIGLKDVLALVLEGNLGLRANQVSQGASRQSLIAAEARLQPNFASSVGNSRSVTPSLTAGAPVAAPPLTSFFSLLAQNSTTLSAGVTKQDWYGTTYSLNYQETRSQGQNLAIVNPGDSPSKGPPAALVDVSSLTAAATVPFGQNSGRDYNRVPVGQAEVGLRLSTITTRLQEQSALNAAAQAYWNLVGQLQTIAVIEQAVRLDEQLVADNQLRVKAGTRVPSDVLATQSQLASDLRNLLQARIQALNLEDQLRAALGLDRVDFGFKPVDAPTFRPATYDPQQQLERVYANSPALASAQATLDNKGYDLLTAENSAKPTLNLALSYTLLGWGNDAASAFGVYGDSQSTGGSATISYAYPLLDRVGPATIERRRNEQQALELQLRDQRNSLANQLQNTLRNIRLAEEQIAAAKVAVDLAQTQLNNEVKRLSLGSSTPFTVAQLQQQLTQAQQLEIAARIQFEQNEMARLVLTGEVYGYYGLTSLAQDSAN